MTIRNNSLRMFQDLSIQKTGIARTVYCHAPELQVRGSKIGHRIGLKTLIVSDSISPHEYK